ncbi:hypothetical protein [Sphingobium sp. B11D3A]|uniref:hypothetical protein n=1 Tax=Sphingobium sp. B11D3A TaxID=2940574 RepID=UPI0022254B4F|nr:hypothetical protein [Sphingobium sp. B11D3A]MCW2393550.1 hypothetical protein [Sphingobium sp. B11D3A]
MDEYLPVPAPVRKAHDLGRLEQRLEAGPCNHPPDTKSGDHAFDLAKAICSAPFAGVAAQSIGVM